MIVIDDSDFRLYQGDVLDCLAELEDESVHCVVTSPPYWGLRDYGTGSWEGGDPDCDHVRSTFRREQERPTQDGNFRATGRPVQIHFQEECERCGAHRRDRQLGSEPTLMDYLENMVDVFREVRRVLRNDGTVWLNMGDCYVSDGAARAANTVRPQVIDSKRNGNGDGTAVRPPGVAGLKQKDLVGVPWRLAFALQDDGWWLRMDNVWFKPNPMPESVVDRPTKAHEYVFLLTKSGTAQFWTNEMRPDVAGVRSKPQPDYWWHPPLGVEADPSPIAVEGWKRRNAWRGSDYFYDKTAVEEDATYYGPNGGPQSMDGAVNSRAGEMKGRAGGGRQRSKPGDYADAGFKTTDERNARYQGPNPSLKRNLRSVWEIPTQPYPQAHFATFPERLPWTAIAAGASEGGCCANCGAPFARIVERDWHAHHTMIRAASARRDNGDDGDRGFIGTGEQEVGAYTSKTVGFRPTCGCRGLHDDLGLGVMTERGETTSVPCTVLDIFMGSGTTAFVARKMGRHAIGIELNPEYCDLIASRTQQLGLGV